MKNRRRARAIKRWASGLERYCIEEGKKHDSFSVQSEYFLGVQIALHVAQGFDPSRRWDTMTRPFEDGYRTAMARFEQVMEYLHNAPSESYEEWFQPAEDLTFSEEDIRREPKYHNPTLPDAARGT